MSVIVWNGSYNPIQNHMFEETKYILVKFYQFSCIQECYSTNSIWKRVWFSLFYMPTFLTNHRLIRPLSFSKGEEGGWGDLWRKKLHLYYIYSPLIIFKIQRGGALQRHDQYKYKFPFGFYASADPECRGLQLLCIPYSKSNK